VHPFDPSGREKLQNVGEVVVGLPSHAPEEGDPLARPAHGLADRTGLGERPETLDAGAARRRSSVAQHERTDCRKLQSSESITVHNRKYLPLLRLRALKSIAGALPIRSVPRLTIPRRSLDRTEYKMRRINGFVKFQGVENRGRREVGYGLD
jgi:hypothetical protein